MNDNYPYDQILLYINGQLQGEELSLFEELLKADKKLLAEVKLNKEIQLAVNDLSFNSYEQKLESITQQFHESDKSSSTAPKIINKKKWIALAATLLLLITCLIWLIIPKPTSEPEVLYAKYITHDFAFTQRGTENLLLEAENLLNNGNYEAALPLLNAYLEKNAEAADVIMATGLVYLELGDTDQALNIFSELKKNHPIFSNDCNWYSALVYLKNGALEQSLRTLELITPSSQRYQTAQQLIGQIQSIKK